MLCEVCLLREAKHRCRLCGRLTCDEDYVEDKGICRICAETLCYICGENYAIALCANCGKPICRAHSVRVGLKRYCTVCAAKLGLIRSNFKKSG